MESRKFPCNMSMSAGRQPDVEQVADLRLAAFGDLSRPLLGEETRETVSCHREEQEHGLWTRRA